MIHIIIVLLILLTYQANELQSQDPKNLLFHKNLLVDVHQVPTLMVEHAVVKMGAVGISVALLILITMEIALRGLAPYGFEIAQQVAGELR